MWDEFSEIISFRISGIVSGMVNGGDTGGDDMFFAIRAGPGHQGVPALFFASQNYHSGAKQPTAVRSFDRVNLGVLFRVIPTPGKNSTIIKDNCRDLKPAMSRTFQQLIGQRHGSFAGVHRLSPITSFKGALTIKILSKFFSKVNLSCRSIILYN